MAWDDTHYPRCLHGKGNFCPTILHNIDGSDKCADSGCPHYRRGAGNARRKQLSDEVDKYPEAFASGGPVTNEPKATSEAPATPVLDLSQMKMADVILEEMAQTFREKNAKYGSNFQKVGGVMQVLFPNGIKLEGPLDFILFHWMDWLVGKLTRFVNTDMTDEDSIHDLAVYASMIKMIVIERNKLMKGN